MHCPNHLLREPVGYCVKCGAFGCADCLTFHEGEYYCKRDFQPIHEELERKRRHEELRHRTERQRLVVHTKKGEISYGSCFAMNPDHDAFVLNIVDAEGESMGRTQKFQFRDLKAVYYVKSYDGVFDRSGAEQDHRREGTGLVLEFFDGEVVKGHTHQTYHETSARFTFIPEDPDSNTLSMLVERSAVKAIHTPQAFHDLKKDELKAYVKAHLEPGKDTEEVVGDFYAAKKDARRALSHYNKAYEHGTQDAVLLKKIVASEYNTAMHYMREKHLTHALQHLERARKFDPKNEAVTQKIVKVRHALRLDRGGSVPGG